MPLGFNSHPKQFPDLCPEPFAFQRTFSGCCKAQDQFLEHLASMDLQFQQQTWWFSANPQKTVVKVQIPICSHWQLYFQTGYLLILCHPSTEGRPDTALFSPATFRARFANCQTIRREARSWHFRWVQKAEIFFPSYSIEMACYLNSPALLPDLHPARLGERANDDPRSKLLSTEICFTLPIQLHRPPWSSMQWHSPMGCAYQYSASFHTVSVMSQIR